MEVIDMKENRNNVLMLQSESYSELVRKLCLPAVLIMLVTVAYNLADIFFIGRSGDPNMIAAVTLASPLFTILSGLGVLMGNGGCTAMSLSLGQRDYETIKKTSAFCIWSCLFIGILFSVTVILFMDPICGLLGATPETKQFTMEYLRIVAIGAPFIMFTNVVPALIRRMDPRALR